MASELAPLPGDPVALKSKADALASAAGQIQQAINQLRKLADRDDTVSDAVDKVRSKAVDVANNITKAHVRYLGTAQALQEYAPKLEAAQQRANRAIAAHGAAQQQVSNAQASLQKQSDQYTQDQANKPASATAGAQPPQSFGNTPAGNLANQAVSDANDAVSSAIQDYNGAVAEVDSAAQTAMSKISSALDDSGLNDSFWDKLGHDISSFAHNAVAWAKKYLAPVLDVIQKIAAAVADIGGYLSMILNILAVFIPVLAPIAAAVDLIVLAAAAVSFLTTLALFGLGDRTLGDLLNTGITLVASALPIKTDAKVLGDAKGFEQVAKVADKAHGVTKVLDPLSTKVEDIGTKVGEHGKDLAKKVGVKYGGKLVDTLAKGRAMNYGQAAIDGVLNHGGSIDEAFNQGMKQAAHGFEEGRQEYAQVLNHVLDHAPKTVGDLAEKSTNALVNVGIVNVTNNATAGVDLGMSHVPGMDYFQHRSSMGDIQTIVPTVGVDASWGGLNPLNVIKANYDMNINAPIGMYHALTGTATMTSDAG